MLETTPTLGSIETTEREKKKFAYRSDRRVYYFHKTTPPPSSLRLEKNRVFFAEFGKKKLFIVK